MTEMMTKARYLDEPEVKLGDQDRIEWAYRAY